MSAKVAPEEPSLPQQPERMGANYDNDEGKVDVTPQKPGGSGDRLQTDKSPKAAGVFEFADSEAMKQRVRQALLKKEPYNVFDFYHETGIFRELATHIVFENVTLGVIAFNAVWIAVDTDYNKSTDLLGADAIFQVMEHFFCMYFTFEWFVRFMAFKRKCDGLKDGWFKFDSALVFLMVMETWVFTVMTIASGKEGGGSPLGGNTAILRLFRLLRLSRLLRMLKSLPELMILIKGMVTAMKSVCYVLALLVIITYVFAIAFTQLAPEGGFLQEQFFKSTALSMYSLLIYGTFLDDLSFFTDSMLDTETEGSGGPVCLALLAPFILLASMTVMNMLIGVLCEVVSAVAATEKEEMLTTSVSEKMSVMIQGLDTDTNGKISYKEFKQILTMPDALRALQEVGVDPVGIVDFADLFFVEDGEYIEIEFSRFMEMVLDLRGCNGATVKDIMNFWAQVSGKFTIANVGMKETKDSVSRMEEDTKASTARIEGNMKEVLAELRKGQNLTTTDC